MQWYRYFVVGSVLALAGCLATADPPHGASIASNLDGSAPQPPASTVLVQTPPPVEPRSVRDLRAAGERLKAAVADLKARQSPHQ